MFVLQTEPLTAISFAEFGRVLDGSGCPIGTVNEGRATRCDLAGFSRQGGRTVLARYDIQKSSLPVEVVTLERHPGDQAFFPLGTARGLVVVTGTGQDGAPDLSAARAFIAGPETPFLYAAKTWHAPLFAIGGAGVFLMAMHESGAPADCETVELATTLGVELGSWDAGIG